MWRAIEAIEAILSCRYQGLHGIKEFTVGHFSAKMSPQHFDRIEPRAIGWQVQQNQSSCCRLYNRIYFFIFMGCGIIPGYVNRFCWMFLYKSSKELGNLLTPLALLELNHGFARMIVDGSNSIRGALLSWCWDHHLLPFRTPHC